MQIPENYLNEIKLRKNTLKITNERQEIIQRITDKINKERAGTKFKDATCRQINVLTSFMPVKDLYWLERTCDKSISFSKKFFGILRDTRAVKN